LAAIVKALLAAGKSNQPPPPPPKVDAPRVSGVDKNGAWTGFGKGNVGTKPKSGYCYREHSFSDKAKALSEINKIEFVCKTGLKDKPTHHFSLPLKQSKVGLCDCLLEFESYSITIGTKGVFNI